MYKIRIIKPTGKSAYFKGDIIEINSTEELSKIKSNNDIEILLEATPELPVDEVKVSGRIKKIK